MRKTFFTILYIAAAIAAVSCAKTEATGPNDAYKRYFDAWMQVNHPEAKPTGIGIYIMEEQLGKGETVGEEGFVLVDYRITDLEGNISSYTDALTAQQLGIAVEHRACNTAAQGTFDIRGRIVNKKTLLRL